MVCYANNPRIDFETKVDWHEKWRLLKVQFDTAIDAAQVRCDVQYGHVFRNTHRNLMQDRAKFEICAHKWVSLEEEGGGIALLNDCKYGHDVEGGRIRLSLLRSPIAPDPQADQGEHRFTYALLPFTGNFGSSRIIRSAYELNSPVSTLRVDRGSDGPCEKSLCTIDNEAVIIESVKAPEDASGGLILRLYESLGGRCKATARFSRNVLYAAETDMLEDNPIELNFTQNELNLEFRPFEIKTIRVKV
jgi:alpha-mannosidase